MKNLILILSFCLYGCSDLENSPQPEKIKVGCMCKDGTFIPQNENLLRQTSNLTGESCLLNGGLLNGGLLKYVYK